MRYVSQKGSLSGLICCPVAIAAQVALPSPPSLEQTPLDHAHYLRFPAARRAVYTCDGQLIRFLEFELRRNPLGALPRTLKVSRSAKVKRTFGEVACVPHYSGKSGGGSPDRFHLVPPLLRNLSRGNDEVTFEVAIDAFLENAIIT